MSSPSSYKEILPRLLASLLDYLTPNSALESIYVELALPKFNTAGWKRRSVNESSPETGWSCVRQLELDLRLPRLRRVKVCVLFMKEAAEFVPIKFLEEGVKGAFPLLDSKGGVVVKYVDLSWVGTWPCRDS
jgi:hypothetical protein